MPQLHHQTCLSSVTYSRFLQSKTKATTTFINSPLTGAQIDVKYWIEECGGLPMAFVQVKIPLASATVCHNYAHAGLEFVREEVKCAALLARIALSVLGFNSDEVARYMKTSQTQLLELTWHTRTASTRARLSAQKRTKNFFNGQRKLSSRHDVATQNVDYLEGNGKPGLLVTFKSGDQFRQYGKAEEVASRSKKGSRARMSVEARTYGMRILGAIEDDVRNELLLGEKTLQELGIGHPGSWTAENLRQAIDYVWAMAGLAPKQDGKLSREAEASWQKYLDGADLVAELPAHTFTRHRASIRAAKGEDIAERRKARTVRPEGLGYQLRYDRRWEPVGDLRKLVLCEVTAPAIIEELQRGLAFIENGDIPELDGEKSREEWQSRWAAFAERESGRRKMRHVKQADYSSSAETLEDGMGRTQPEVVNDLSQLSPEQQAHLSQYLTAEQIEVVLPVYLGTNKLDSKAEGSAGIVCEPLNIAAVKTPFPAAKRAAPVPQPQRDGHQRAMSGIGNAPVPPGMVDQLIFFNNEWRVI